MCHKSLLLAQDTCERLGIQLACNKLEGLAMELVFLGIVLDTQKLEMHLPEESRMPRRDGYAV